MNEHEKMECPAGQDAPMIMRHFVLLGLLAATAAAAQRFSSGETRTHLIELYSSEGCSSCPPAEEWLGRLRDDPGLWRDFVPVAFHVDYWDQLGWRDRFACKEFTVRQYAWSSQWGVDMVYTPCFVLDGAEWRNGSNHPPRASAEKAGILSVEYAANGTCRVSFAATGDDEVHAALLGGGISSSVKAGENEGRTLGHEFVVLVLKSTRLTCGAAALILPKSADKTVTRQALAVWVTRHGELLPLQAAGGWLD
jgi:hypothetical protein